LFLFFGFCFSVPTRRSPTRAFLLLLLLLLLLSYAPFLFVPPSPTPNNLQTKTTTAHIPFLLLAIDPKTLHNLLLLMLHTPI